MGVPGYYKWLVQHCEAIKQEEMPVDNLYLDMNGILHPVCHNDGVSNLSEETMLSDFCLKLDEIIQKTKPQKLIYLAFDGPAPNAKMVQQRSRRFCARQNMATYTSIYKAMAEKCQKNNESAPELPPIWDSNKITPGTPFMTKVRKLVESYISNRISDSGWSNFQGVTWLLSDSSAPGEGEHKLIQFIKKQRDVAGYDKRTTHCLVGSDADLIQLALSIHDPNISIFREDHFISINIVREYFRQCFATILNNPDIPDKLKDFERLLDDLLLCFCFVGNDFIPPLPQMKITSNAIGRCLSVYISELPAIGDFLTHAGKINPIALGQFIQKLATILQDVSDPTEHEVVKWYDRIERSHLHASEYNEFDASERFWKALRRQCDLHVWIQAFESVCNDAVSMEHPGWQERYYRTHWPDEPDLEVTHGNVSQEYLRGLQWVQKYYHQECPDWEWFYPYEHGPTLDTFRPELCDASCLRFASHGSPLQPLQQLLIVIPRKDAEALLPKSWTGLMDTDLIEYFPAQYPVDYSNCPPKWMAKALLPPIDLQKVREITAPHLESLSEKEKKRMRRTETRLFVHRSHSIAREEIPSETASLKIDSSIHGIKGLISARKTQETYRVLSKDAVRFSFDMAIGQMLPSYLKTPPRCPTRKFVHAGNSFSPISLDDRQSWVGLSGLSYPLWRIHINSSGALCHSAKQPAEK